MPSPPIHPDDGLTSLAALATDPLRLVRVLWPDMKLYEKQHEILLSVTDNCETFVHAANELGKTRIAAVVAICFFASRTPARVVTSSSSETQLNSILWTEIRNLIERAALPLPFLVKNLLVRKLKHSQSVETEPLDYIIGHVTNTVENFQGHHLPNDKPRVLAIFDEASGVPDEFYDASDSWAHRKLVIGNPLSTTNFFYRMCAAGDQIDPAGEGGLLRKVIHIGGLDSPNVRAGIQWQDQGHSGSPPMLIPGLLTHAEYLRRLSKWDQFNRTTRLDGQFYLGHQSQLFPADALQRAMDPDLWKQLHLNRRPVEAIGVDIAGGGRDQTVWTLIDERGVIDQICADTPDTMAIVGRTKAMIEEHDLDGSRVALDVGGLGKGVVDRLWEMNLSVQAIHFGEAAGLVDDECRIKGVHPRKAYRNRRAEIYGALREVLRIDQDEEGESPFAIPPDATELQRELSVIPLSYDSEGRLVLPPKEAIRSDGVGRLSLRGLLGRSPDRADSLVLAVHALRTGRKKEPEEDWGGLITGVRARPRLPHSTIRWWPKSNGWYDSFGNLHDAR